MSWRRDVDGTLFVLLSCWSVDGVCFSLLPVFAQSKFCTLIMCLFSCRSAFLFYFIKVCKICIDREVTGWFALFLSAIFRHLYESNQRWHSDPSHVSIIPDISTKPFIFIRVILYHFLVLSLLLIPCKFCASAVTYLADICQKHRANSVLVTQMCNVSSCNNSTRHCCSYLYSKCIFRCNLISHLLWCFSSCWVYYILRWFVKSKETLIYVSCTRGGWEVINA